MEGNACWQGPEGAEKEAVSFLNLFFPSPFVLMCEILCHMIIIKVTPCSITAEEGLYIRLILNQVIMSYGHS